MSLMSFSSKPLSERQVFGCFVLAAFIYVLPLILADFFYIDDNWRSLAAGNAWTGQGRWLVDLFYQALTFTSGAPNVFPLALLMAVVAIALALKSLTFHYAEQPVWVDCLVVLPLWYNPFFLQNLSYQYDGPTMALSLVAVIYATTLRFRSMALQVVIPGGLVAVGMGLYQLSINVFLGLCCIELVRIVSEAKPWRALGALLAMKSLQLIVAALAYGLTGYPFIVAQRLPMQALSEQGLARVAGNLQWMASNVGLLFEGGYRGLLWAMLVCAVLGGWRVFVALRARPDGLWRKLLLGVACVLCVPALLLLVPGATLLFRDFNEGARTLMGFSVLGVFVYDLARRGLVAIDPRLGLLLVIPLLSMLALSFAYGRVLSVQKEFATSALFSLGHDIASHPRLREAKRIYMSITPSDRWLEEATGSLKVMPVLRYILNVNFFMLAENLPRVGVNNVLPENERRNATHVGYRGYTPVVDSQFYNLYLVGDYGFIVMKEPSRP